LRLKLLGAVKDDHAGSATDGSPPALKAVRDLVMKQVAKEPTAGEDPPLSLNGSQSATGIEVHEEKWGTVTVQVVYKMRCECGRSWFELELPRFVKCPACHQLDFVSR
jgi:hypothetical protein